MTDAKIDSPAPSVSSCTHHWVIETPSGPTSSGFCKKCYQIRDGFKNLRSDLDFYRFDEDKAS